MSEGRRVADVRESEEKPLRKEDAPPPEQHAMLALQRQAGNQATARMIARLLKPGKVTKPSGTGLHKFRQPSPTRHRVRTGGVFGTGIKQQIPVGTLIHVDPQKANATYIWAETAANQGYIKKTSVTEADRVGASNYYAVDISPTTFQVYDMDTRAFVGPPIGLAVKPEVTQSFGHALGSVTNLGLTLDGKVGLLEALAKSVTLGVIPDPALWQLAAGHVATAQQRVATDRAQLIAAGLITAQHQLTSVKFTGADFHKGGQAPFFLTFTAPGHPPDVRKIVYKPGNLQVDKLIFGRGNTNALTGAQEPSLAEALNPANDAISQYTIVAKPTYGYMQFVSSATGPQDAADVLGIYKSLAANMALSYVVGLEDVHNENVLMLKDRVQVIDMEATTGQFTADRSSGALDPTKGGFSAQLWNRALELGIKQKLLEAVGDNSLASVPDTGTLATALTAAFRGVLETTASAAFDQQFAATTGALNAARARVVPVATADFYSLIMKAQGKTQGQWNTLVDTNPTQAGSLAMICKGQTSSSIPFFQRMLKAPGTLASLQRGEVPYYWRNLNDDTQIFDELNNPINATGFVKVSGEIEDQMEDRRDTLQQQGFGGGGPGVGTRNNSDAVRIFTAQMIPVFVGINTELTQRIAARGA